jgi:hypothetical protein
MMTDEELEAKRIDLMLQLLASRRKTAALREKIRAAHERHVREGLCRPDT